MGLFKDDSQKTWEKALKALEKEKWAKALPLVKKVADEGLSSAQYQYALLLEQGLGTAPNAAEAALWYEKAAQQKHLKAMLTMARLLLKSPETYGNTAKAYTWYQNRLRNNGKPVFRRHRARRPAEQNGSHSRKSAGRAPNRHRPGPRGLCGQRLRKGACPFL